MLKKIFRLIIIGLVVIGVALIFIRQKDSSPPPKKKPKQIAAKKAERWAREHSPTYTFDGTELEFVKMDKLENGGYDIVFKFSSRYTGYGDRKGKISAPAITPHRIEIRVQKKSGGDLWKITRAVTDETFDEINEEFIDDRPEKKTRAVDLFFIQVEDRQEEVVPLSREITYESGIEKAALEALLSGLSQKEKEKGYMTAINQGTEILDFKIVNKRAEVSFNQKIDEDVAGSATVMAIRDQIESTLTQFEGVEKVRISVNGETDSILQP